MMNIWKYTVQAYILEIRGPSIQIAYNTCVHSQTHRKKLWFYLFFFGNWRVTKLKSHCWFFFSLPIECQIETLQCSRLIHTAISPRCDRHGWFLNASRFTSFSLSHTTQFRILYRSSLLLRLYRCNSHKLPFSDLSHQSWPAQISPTPTNTLSISHATILICPLNFTTCRWHRSTLKRPIHIADSNSENCQLSKNNTSYMHHVWSYMYISHEQRC